MGDVLVVSGLPRSGTSLAMAILGAGGVRLRVDGARAADPDNPAGYHEYEPVRRLAQDGAWLSGARGEAVKIVVPLLRALPAGLPCRVILMRREIREVVTSQDRMLARRGASPGPLGAERVAEILTAQLEETRTWLRQRPHTAWIEIDHHALVHGAGEELARLAAFAGIPAPGAELAAVIRRDLHRVRLPKGEGPAAAAAGPSKGQGR